MYFATRSLTEPVGLRPSSLAQRRTSGLGVSRGSSTSGVLPIASRTFSKWPPQGRLRSGSLAIQCKHTSESEVQPHLDFAVTVLCVIRGKQGRRGLGTVAAVALAAVIVAAPPSGTAAKQSKDAKPTPSGHARSEAIFGM